VRQKAEHKLILESFEAGSELVSETTIEGRSTSINRPRNPYGHPRLLNRGQPLYSLRDSVSVAF
jgi:hypothetical protein